MYCSPLVPREPIQPAAWVWGHELHSRFMRRLFSGTMACGPGRMGFVRSTTHALPGDPVVGNPLSAAAWLGVEIVTPSVLLLDVFRVNADAKPISQKRYSVNYRSLPGFYRIQVALSTSVATAGPLLPVKPLVLRNPPSAVWRRGFFCCL